MSEEQIERLIDVLARFHADVHHDLKEISSQLHDTMIAQSRVVPV